MFSSFSASLPVTSTFIHKTLNFIPFETKSFSSYVASFAAVVCARHAIISYSNYSVHFHLFICTYKKECDCERPFSSRLIGLWASYFIFWGQTIWLQRVIQTRRNELSAGRPIILTSAVNIRQLGVSKGKIAGVCDTSSLNIFTVSTQYLIIFFREEKIFLVKRFQLWFWLCSWGIFRAWACYKIPLFLTLRNIRTLARSQLSRGNTHRK